MPITMKFNPGFQTDAEAIENFVVRGAELGSLLEIFSAAGSAKALVVAPRGAGKTTLCRRMLAETRGDGRLASEWHAVFLGEESYAVTTPGEFFLECLFHLKDQDQQGEIEGWYKAAAASRSEEELLDRALSALKEYSAKLHKKLLVIVENFHTLLRDQIGSESENLLKELEDLNTFGVLATSVARAKGDKHFDQLSKYETITLNPLTLPECQLLWMSLSGQAVAQERIRPLQILTGGSPRLLHILAEFMKTPSLHDLMENLNLLIDQNTEYFKSQLENLPTVERKVFAALLDLWDPSSAKQIAESARVETNIASAMLSRLSDRGAVIKEAVRGKQAYYYASERLFNIYYLMRRRSHPSNRVRALVSFMTEYYDRDELVSTTALLVREACSVEPDLRGDYHSAFDAIISRASEGVRRRILEETPQEFIQSFRAAQRAQRGEAQGEAPNDTGNSQLTNIVEQIERAADDGDTAKTEELLRAALVEHPDVAELWMRLALLQYRLEKLDDAVDAARNALRLNESGPWAHAVLGMLLLRAEKDEEGVALLEAALSIDPNQIMAIIELADHYDQQGSPQLALKHYERAAQAGPLQDTLLARYSQLLIDQDRSDEAESLLRQNAISDPEAIYARRTLAVLLQKDGRKDEAIEMLRDAAKQHDTWEAWSDFGVYLQFRGREKAAEARAALERAIALGATEPQIYRALSEVMMEVNAPANEIIALVDKLIASNDGKFSAYTVAGHIYNDLDEDDLAESSWRTAIELGSNLARMHLARLISSRDLAEAEALYREAADKAGDRCRPAKELAEFLIHKGDDAEAGEILEANIKRHENCVCSLVLQGQVCARKKELKAAREHFEAALQRQNNLIPALTGLAAVVDSENAKELIQRAVEEDPDDARPLLARAQLGLGSREERIADAEAALVIDDQYTEARLLLAQLQAEANLPDAALENLAIAVAEVGRQRELISALVASTMGVAKCAGSDDIIALLAGHDGEVIFEPLKVALQISRGEEPLVAKEVLEVAKDIVDRFK